MQQRVCYRCLVRDLVDADRYRDTITKFISVLSKEDRADDALYEQRLTICRECEKLHEGTCGACGCYVEIRAAGKGANCPHHKW